jgi:glycosyltransferase involved in cell wall biosynthesis
MLRRKDFKIAFLSVIVPSFKQERTILRDIKNIQSALEELDYKYEIIVVVDGVIDGTLKKLQKIKSSKIRILSYGKNQGKGHAVRVGMMKARGDVIGFIDAGMDIHPAGFRMLLNHMEWYDADVIVGSKLHPVSKVNYPFYRKILSWGYRLITHLLFGFTVRDTQVGLKFFKRKVVRDVLPRLSVKSYAFDIEILAVSYQLGYKKIYEAPIILNFNKNTLGKNNLVKIIFLMLWDTAAVFYRLKILNYYKEKRRVRKKAPGKLRLGTQSQ